MALDVFRDPSHDEPANAVRLDPEAIARLDPARGGDRAWNSYLVMS
jgi:hypothetical protein